jgi:hypothetical protein
MRATRACIGAAVGIFIAVGLITVIEGQAEDTHGPQKTDSLYIGDTKDDSVRRFDVPTGDFGDIFVRSGSGGLHGPRGMVFD